MLITIGNDTVSIEQIRGYNEVVVIVVECLVLLRFVFVNDNVGIHESSGDKRIMMLHRLN